MHNETKGEICTKIEFNPQKNIPLLQHGRRFFFYSSKMATVTSCEHTPLFSFQGILDRLNAHKRDLEALRKAAQEMGEVDEDGCAIKEMEELIERFESLQKNLAEKKEFFQRVTGKWRKFAEQKHKMNAFFKNTHGIVTKRQVKNADDCKKQIEECKVIKNS